MTAEVDNLNLEHAGQPHGAHPNLARPRGVLLVGHGTREELGTRQFFELGQRLADHVHPLPIQSALLEFQRPTIPEAWDSLVAQGVRHVHVAPLLLFAAGHAKQDIPAIIAQCQAKTPQVTFDQSRPLSRHRSIIELVLRRLAATTRHLESPPDRCALVMVGRGSHDPCAQADMRVLSEIVGRRMQVASTRTAFYAMAEPRLVDVLDRVAGEGFYRTVLVHPHLLFDGRLYRAILEQTAAAAHKHPDVRFVTSPYLGPDAMVAKAIASRLSVPKTSADGLG